MKKFRIIIAGGRDFDDWELFKENVSYYILTLPPAEVEIVSGCADGADMLGERYASVYSYPVKRFPADWGKHGQAAGPIRNKEMAAYGTHLIAFWDGKSKGTRNMIEQAKKAGLIIRIIKY